MREPDALTIHIAPRALAARCIRQVARHYRVGLHWHRKFSSRCKIERSFYLFA